MIKRAIFSTILCLSLTNCGMLSDNSSTSDLAVGALVGTAAGAGIGAAIGSAISDGDVEKSIYAGAAIGLAVGAVGTYAYREIKVHNTIVDNDETIENNRNDILSKQAEIDSLREEILLDTYSIQVDQGKFDNVYDGATLGNYYR